MSRAIKYTCSHCQRAIYFDQYVSRAALSSLECRDCGRNVAVLALDIDVPPDTTILHHIPVQWDLSVSPHRTI